MAEPTLNIYGEGSYQDTVFFYINKGGLRDKIQEISTEKNEESLFTPNENNTLESLLLAMAICQEKALTQENLSLDKVNRQVTFSSFGKALDVDENGDDLLIFSYQIQFKQPVNLPGPNPDSI